jgi:hypothetical protein
MFWHPGNCRVEGTVDDNVLDSFAFDVHSIESGNVAQTQDRRWPAVDKWKPPCRHGGTYLKSGIRAERETSGKCLGRAQSGKILICIDGQGSEHNLLSGGRSGDEFLRSSLPLRGGLIRQTAL